ncbi:MAG: type II toxin-antitoxin system RelE/ParE family toxin [Prevotella sp.]|nr:type II toxin-antitoxin system RelE/ParE family toxin [Prevotella sp.]
MALELIYSHLFADSLEEILQFYAKRNGDDKYSQKLLEKIQDKLQLLSVMPEIGRKADFHDVRTLFVGRYCIDYQIRKEKVLIINIYSSLTNPEERFFKKL